MPSLSGHEQVPEADVGERAAHHHLVVPAPRAVRVEVLALDAVLDQVAAAGAVRLDGAGRRDVVGRDGVAGPDEAAGAGDVVDGSGLAAHALEVRWAAHVGRVGIPGEELALGHVERAPAVVAREDVGVGPAEHVLLHRLGDRVGDLARARPEVAKEDVVPVAVRAERLVDEVDVHPARERVGDDERRRGEVVRLHLRVDARLEVPVAREHRRRRRGRPPRSPSEIGPASGPEFPMQVVQP